MTRPLRHLTRGELALARSVFGDAIDYAAVRLAPVAPLGFAVTLGPVILFPPGSPEDFAAANLQAQAWLVHELTHVWQWASAPGRTIRSWAGALLTGGYGPGLPAYRYGLPLRPFEHYGLEQQASIVEHAFLLRQHARTPAMPEGARREHYAGATPFPALSCPCAPEPAAGRPDRD